MKLELNKMEVEMLAEILEVRSFNVAICESDAIEYIYAEALLYKRMKEFLDEI